MRDCLIICLICAVACVGFAYFYVFGCCVPFCLCFVLGWWWGPWLFFRLRCFVYLGWRCLGWFVGVEVVRVRRYRLTGGFGVLNGCIGVFLFWWVFVLVRGSCLGRRRGVV